jgi:hypothetical protein
VYQPNQPDECKPHHDAADCRDAPIAQPHHLHQFPRLTDWPWWTRFRSCGGSLIG